jgi:hypothetical protein
VKKMTIPTMQEVILQILDESYDDGVGGWHNMTFADEILTISYTPDPDTPTWAAEWPEPFSYSFKLLDTGTKEGDSV